MDFNIKRVVSLRIYELFSFSTVLSVLCTVLNKCGILNTNAKLGVGLFFAGAIFIGVNMLMMKECYLGLKKKLKLYFQANILSYLMYAAVSLATVAFIPARFTSWFFSITLVAKYWILYYYKIPSIAAMCIFHAAGIISVVSVPVIMVYNDIGTLKFWRAQKPCPRCKTGKESFELDNKSTVCPYIRCLKKNKCDYYKPLKK